MKVIHAPVVDAEIAKFKARHAIREPRRRSWLLWFVEWLGTPMPKFKSGGVILSTPPTPQPEVRVTDPPFAFDPSAFWLYPDWDGPLKEPFWMRPLRQPESRGISAAPPRTYAHSRREHQTGFTYYFDERGRQIGVTEAERRRYAAVWNDVYGVSEGGSK